MEVVVNNDKSQVIEAAFLPRQRFDVSASSSPSSSRGCGGFALVVEVCRNGILGRGVSDGDFQELLRHSWGLVPERVNECLTRGVASEGVDDVGDDVGQLVALAREALDVLSEGHLVLLLPVGAQLP